MKNYLSYKKITPSYLEVFFENGVYLGDILQKEDGFFDWWPEHPSKGGCWASYVLRELADKLDELNAPYEKQIEEYFANEKTTSI